MSFQYPLPVIVRVYVPAGVLFSVLIFRTVFAPLDVGVIGFWANDPVAPAGRPDTDNETDSSKPPRDLTTTVYVVSPPGEMVRWDGQAVIEKSGETATA